MLWSCVLIDGSVERFGACVTRSASPTRGISGAGQAWITWWSILMPRSEVTSTSKETRSPFRQTVENPVRPMPNRDQSAPTQKRGKKSGSLRKVPHLRLDGFRKGFRKGSRHPADSLSKGLRETISPWHPMNSSSPSRNSPDTSACPSEPFTSGDTDAKDHPDSASAGTSATGGRTSRIGSANRWSPPKGDVSRPVCTLDTTRRHPRCGYADTVLEGYGRRERETWRTSDDTRCHQVGGKSDT